jgi:hypothetical protein
MYDNGLQDSELQEYHKELKYSVNLFLEEIIATGSDWQDYFIIEEMGDYYKIYPLFYTDTIYTDGDNVVIDSPYKITVPKDYKQIITFYGEDGQYITSKSSHVEENGNFCSIVIYQTDTGEFLPYQKYTIVYSEHPAEQHKTGANGYGSFTKKESTYTVVVE